MSNSGRAVAYLVRRPIWLPFVARSNPAVPCQGETLVAWPGMLFPDWMGRGQLSMLAFCGARRSAVVRYVALVRQRGGLQAMEGGRRSQHEGAKKRAVPAGHEDALRETEGTVGQIRPSSCWPSRAQWNRAA